VFIENLKFLQTWIQIERFARDRIPCRRGDFYQQQQQQQHNIIEHTLYKDKIDDGQTV
jgi:23S rRNA maturation-related 3'-5' exoribonuclease YhaM